MKRAQRLLVHTAVAASLALGAASAQAIPLTFAFTASVRETIIFNEFGQATYDPSHNGEAVTGAIVVETDGLLSETFTSNFGTSLIFRQATNSGLFSSALTIGGTAVDVGAYDRDTGSLQIIDSNGPQPCGDGCSSLTPDQVGVGFRSSNFPLIFDQPLNGVFLSRSLSLGWSDPDNQLGLIDLSRPFGPLDILNVPIAQAFALFTQQVENCRDDFCSFGGQTVTNFTIDSLSVTAAAVPVPEPGTLSLFLLGLLATAGNRSRRALRSLDRN